MNSRTAAQTGSRFSHRLHHQRRFGNPHASAAKLLRHGDTEPAALRHFGHKFVGEFAIIIPV
ncbi:MAG: hypothetical protein P1U54_03225 [Immundisolibacteraceae bacterium]|nr:hypothetical protein [Immundisolibacteraceae bacterium]